MEIIQSLTEPCDRKTYGIKKREAAQKLGVSLRQVERLLQKWQEQGMVGITTTRLDKGKYCLEQDWVDFIINTYTNGNKGSKQMTRHQVFLRVKGRAKQLVLSKGEYPVTSQFIEFLTNTSSRKRKNGKQEVRATQGSG